MNRLVVLAAGLAACTSVSTFRLAPETVAVGPGLRPIAGIQATATTVYVLFIPIPGRVDLDRVVNRKLIAGARAMGADKVTNLTFHAECPGICLAKFLGIVKTHAHGIAVQVVEPAPE